MRENRELVVLAGLSAVFAACAGAPSSYDTGVLAVDQDARPFDSSHPSDVSDQPDSDIDTQKPDAGEMDAGGGTDFGLADAVPVDAGTDDAGVRDAGATDTGALEDSATPDAVTEDVGVRDAGTTADSGLDAATPDAGSQDAGGVFDEDPIVFVHGWLWNAKDWQDFIDHFKGVGYPDEFLAAIQYSDTAGSNVKNARDELAPFVDGVLAKTGRQRVDIVGHSMAGLSVRLYILKYGGKDKVRDVFLLAPTNHGGTEACLVTWMGDGAKEMCPDYAAQDKSVNSVQWDLNGDPASDDVDETPYCVGHGTGELFYTTLRDGKDTFAVPHHTACLNQKSKGDCSDPLNLDPGFNLGHFGLLHDQRVFEIVEQKLRAHNPARPR